MELWPWILLACLVVYATKLAGYFVPRELLKRPRMIRVAGTMTIGLLASLTIVNAVASGQGLVLDARLGALAAAAVALWLRAPFLVVVLTGAAAAAARRELTGCPERGCARKPFQESASVAAGGGGGVRCGWRPQRGRPDGPRSWSPAPWCPPRRLAWQASSPCLQL